MENPLSGSKKCGDELPLGFWLSATVPVTPALQRKTPFGDATHKFPETALILAWVSL
jgi:hypothetical protein